MNQAMTSGEFGKESQQQQAPATETTPVTETKTEATTQQTPPKTTIKQTAQAAPKTETTDVTDKNTPPNPPFVGKTKATPAKQQAPAAATSKETQQTPVSTELSDDAFFTHLSKVTRGMIKDKAGWEAHIVSHNQLVEEKERGFEPNYKDARTRWVHDLMVKNAGSEPEAAMRVLRALQFKPEGKTPIDILVQGALLDPKFSGKSEAQIQAYVNAKFQKNYGIIAKPLDELTPEQQQERVLAEMELDNEVANAKASVQKILDEFQASEEKPRQIDERVQRGISSAVQKFSGLKLSFSENPSENEILNVPIEDAETLQSLEQDILNPDAAYNERLTEFETETGMDWNALVQDTYERKHHKELRRLAFEHGLKLGQLAKIREDNNSSTPKELQQVAKGGGGNQPTSFWGAMEQAFAEQGR